MAFQDSLSVASGVTLVIASAGIGFLVGTRLYAKNLTNVTESTAGHETVALSASEECKMVLVVRTDLGMSTGKIAAQCSHATLACYQSLQQTNRTVGLHPFNEETKIALKCSDEAELLDLQNQATRLKLCARSIRDAGRTQIAAGSRTVLGIVGMAPFGL
ncbi:hypothetical protein NP233_g8122 [Leucocoprinus birnbaumii]|uniref:peptidyl-tRNA hydrolase n=1 Tax=Leucocoprinus birnbaumii TaxID=56174 RepID=A0AAD5VMW0_9AGAR|nr:hypothetical protein NP233_g8122 [Leucocoprinus birnbaumii]